MKEKRGRFFLTFALVGIAFFVVVILPDLFSLADSFNLKFTQILPQNNAGQINENNIENSSAQIETTNPSLKKIPVEPVILLSDHIKRGDTVYDLLKKSGVSSEKSYLILRSLKSVFNPRNCKPGDKLELQKTYQDNLLIFKYSPGGLYYYLVEEIKPGVFSARREELPREKILVGAQGTISSSLYEAMKAEGIGTELIMNFAEIFSWEIDFLTDPRKGDTFRLIWERYIDPEGKTLLEGKILAAQYINKDHNYTAILYTDPEQKKNYYTPEGKSLRKSFLRSPLNYRRISSYFSYHRFHPILKIYRPHLGIDYAAPTGTPVSSVADGTVIFAGWRGGYGRCIKIKHPGGYITSYGHLSRFARGIRKGSTVNQGQVIGYVGATGLATGPHLDFRITRNGKYLNFLRLKLPRAASVKNEYLEDFKKTRDFYIQKLAILSQASENILVLSPQASDESGRDEEEAILSFSSQVIYLSSNLMPLSKTKCLI